MGEKWPIDLSVLERISPFSLGQIVRVMNDKDTIEAMQNRFGDHLTFSVCDLYNKGLPIY